MVQTGQFVHDYLGNPDMDMVSIAKGFGVDGEVVEARGSCKRRWRARASTRSRANPIWIDAQVRAHGRGMGRNPWMPPIQVASLRQKKV